MKKILVSGYYGSGNAGDEAILAAMIETMTGLDPDVDITVISSNPLETTRHHGVGAVGFTDFSAIFRELRASSLLISGGGSLLQNVTSVRSLYYYLGIIAMARILRTPVMLYAQGIGPVIGGNARLVTKAVVDGTALVTVRDEGSYEELLRIGVTRPLMEVTADPVLAIRPVPPDSGRRLLSDYGVDVGERPVIGLSVREWRGWTRYKEAVARAVLTISRKLDAEIVFFPMQAPDDINAARSIASMMEDDIAVVIDRELMTGSLLSLVGNLDFLISVRLHALIFAGVMGVPSVGISYDPKVDRFLASIGEVPAGRLDDVTPESIVEAVMKKWDRRKKYREESCALFGKLRELAERNARLALGLAGSHPGGFSFSGKI